MTTSESSQADRLKVVVTGATGNVGTSVIEALAARDEVGEIVGLARHEPAWQPEKTSWIDADVVGSDLAPIFAGADAVIHLAWATRPAHDPEALGKINVEGSRRVFEAVAASGVPKLIYASSVSAYSPGPKCQRVGEDWPVGGTETSLYSLHKAAVEEKLDEFEARAPATRVVRLRPALIFKGEAAPEIRRLFAGPLLPTFLLRNRLVPAVPRLSGLCLQAVHSADVGRACALATTRDVRGAFNLAADPPLGSEELVASLDAGTFPMPLSIARRLADLSWRLRLQPTSPEWLDMVRNAPLMSSRESPSSRLVRQLTDLRAIEEQALAQMRRAPKIAGDDRFARIFEEHRAETEEQERRLRERLEAHGAEPSRREDAAEEVGGIGTVVFAASQPDTPGRLAAHAYSYAHMEIAAYELLRRAAEAAGDGATVAMARQTAEEEERMAARLASCFDLVVATSLNGDGPAELGSQLDRYLADAHAIEKQGLQLLEMAQKAVDDAELEEWLKRHLRESEEHEWMLRERLEARGAKHANGRDAVLRVSGQQAGAFFAAQPDTAEKLTGFCFAFEHLEIAAYELLERVAVRAEDAKVAGVAARILSEERAAAAKLANRWERMSEPA